MMVQQLGIESHVRFEVLLMAWVNHVAEEVAARPVERDHPVVSEKLV